MRNDIGRIFSDSGWVLLTILAAPFFILFLAALAGPLMQHIPIVSIEPVKPQMSRISPLSGLKRMFGKEAMVNFAKHVLPTDEEIEQVFRAAAHAPCSAQALLKGIDPSRMPFVMRSLVWLLKLGLLRLV